MTYHPTSRVLTVLELLQAAPLLTGPEIAARLEVDVRTVRRYVAQLQDLGIPVEASPGRGGGYQLRPGYKLPPLIFTADEATALALGLRAAGRLGLAEVAPAVAGALAKLERVLPDAARGRVLALQSDLTVDSPAAEPAVSGALVADMSLAARECRRAHIRYAGEGGATERAIDPYGVVCYDGRWYVVARCHLRGGLRSFRLDRVLEASFPAGGGERFERPAGFDCLEHLTRSIADIPDRWEVEVVLDQTLEEARGAFPRSLAVLEQRPGGVWMRSRIGDLGIIARALAAAGRPFRVIRPPELGGELRRLAATLLEGAGG